MGNIMKIKKTESKKKEKKSKSEEPWVKVIKLHVQPENPRNGFFELDWNDEFVNMLKTIWLSRRVTRGNCGSMVSNTM
jgi:hypothetical protein